MSGPGLRRQWRARGRTCLYDTLWAGASRAENWYQACVVAHFLAHAHVKPEAQLPWHLHALQAADAVDEVRVRPFYPSHHANLGDVYLRLGNLTQAQAHIGQASKQEPHCAQPLKGFTF